MSSWTKFASTLALATVITSLAGCGTTTEYVYVNEPIPVPARPEVPTVEAGDLACLSDEAYEALAVRDQKLQNHIELLEGLIRTTHTTGRSPEGRPKAAPEER